MICPGLCENCKNLFPVRKTNLSLSQKISSHKTQKVMVSCQCPKIYSCKILCHTVNILKG